MIAFCALHRLVFRQLPVNLKSWGVLPLWDLKMKHLFFALFALLFWALPLSAQNYPDYSEVYVNDFAALLSEKDEEKLRGILKELRAERGIEFAVITINSMSNYDYQGEIEPFATGLFNYWSIGDAARNDGVMMLVSRDDRKMRIEVGSGYGSSKDRVMKDIIEDDTLPYFRRDEYSKGILRGAEAVILNLTGSRPGEYDASPKEKAFNKIKRFIDRIGDWIWAIVVPLLYFPINAYRRWRRYRPKICPVDGTEMQLIEEAWDDDHLKEGQIAEERLKSVDYDVWQCDDCSHLTIEAYRAWFTRYGACRSCGYRTLEGDETIEIAATTSSTGLKRIDYTCHHCGDAWSVKRVISKKSKSPSSSGSFSGGSSSGGGASGSW